MLDPGNIFLNTLYTTLFYVTAGKWKSFIRNSIFLLRIRRKTKGHAFIAFFLWTFVTYSYIYIYESRKLQLIRYLLRLFFDSFRSFRPPMIYHFISMYNIRKSLKPRNAHCKIRTRVFMLYYFIGFYRRRIRAFKNIKYNILIIVVVLVLYMLVVHSKMNNENGCIM